MSRSLRKRVLEETTFSVGTQREINQVPMRPVPQELRREEQAREPPAEGAYEAEDGRLRDMRLKFLQQLRVEESFCKTHGREAV